MSADDKEKRLSRDLRHQVTADELVVRNVPGRKRAQNDQEQGAGEPGPLGLNPPSARLS